MIEEDTIDSIVEPEIRDEIKAAFATLYARGVFLLQGNINFTRLAEGEINAPSDQLALAIQEYRRDSVNLLTLHQLGEKYAKEQNNA